MYPLQDEYVESRAAAADWHNWVQHNWLPVLSLALGPHWQTKYDSEVRGARSSCLGAAAEQLPAKCKLQCRPRHIAAAPAWTAKAHLLPRLVGPEEGANCPRLVAVLLMGGMQRCPWGAQPATPGKRYPKVALLLLSAPQGCLHSQTALPACELAPLLSQLPSSPLNPWLVCVQVAAIIALQLSLQPPGEPAVQQGPSAAAMGAASAAASAAQSAASAQNAPQAAGPAGTSRLSPTSGAMHRSAQPAPAPAQAVAPACHPQGFEPGAGFPVRAFSLECVDVDGKRRRLRRKRAASPDLCPPPPAAPGDAKAGSARQGKHAGGAAAAGAGAGGAPPPQLGAGAGSAAGLAVAMQPPLAVLPDLQGVVTQVSQLSLGGDGAGPQDTESCLAQGEGEGGLNGQQPPLGQPQADLESFQLPGSQAPGQHPQQARGGGSGKGAGAAGPAVVAAECQGGPDKDRAAPPASAGSVVKAAAAPAAGQAGSSREDEDGGGKLAGDTGGSSGGGGGQQLLQRSLLDSLNLVQDLSRRIVTDLREAAEARGLSLPQQVKLITRPAPVTMLPCHWGRVGLGRPSGPSHAPTLQDRAASWAAWWLLGGSRRTHIAAAHAWLSQRF